MATFKYQAKSLTGQLIKGFLEAKEQKEAIRKLRERQLIPIKLDIVRKKKTRIKLTKIIDFTRELCELLEGGLPLDRALEMLATSEEKLELKNLIMELVEAIKGGKSFSEALSDYQYVFGRFYIQMIRVGEAAGTLPTTLNLIVHYLEMQQQLKEQLISASIYPSILLTVGIISLLVLLGYVVPRFSQVFLELHQEVPVFMKFLLAIGYFLNHYGWVFPVLLIFILLGFRQWTSRPAGRYKWHETLLKIGYLKNILVKIEMIKFTRTMGILLKAGVGILEALDTAKEVMSNEVLRRITGQLKQEIRRGKRLSFCFRRPPFPAKMATILTVAEETGDLGQGFLNINRIFEEELGRIFKRILSLIEPVIIVSMGIIIGSIIFTMFSAIMGINEIKF